RWFAAVASALRTSQPTHRHIGCASGTLPDQSLARSQPEAAPLLELATSALSYLRTYRNRYVRVPRNSGHCPSGAHIEDHVERFVRRPANPRKAGIAQDFCVVG